MLYSQRFCRSRRKGCFCFPDAESGRINRLHIGKLEATRTRPSAKAAGRAAESKMRRPKGSTLI